jgi:hypothetical protein
LSDVVAEILLRLVKPAIAALIGLAVYLAAVTYGVPPSVHLALMCWVSGAVFVLLVQESPL